MSPAFSLGPAPLMLIDAINESRCALGAPRSWLFADEDKKGTNYYGNCSFRLVARCTSCKIYNNALGIHNKTLGMPVLAS